MAKTPSQHGKEAAPKIGAGHLAAMGRPGLKELAQILPAMPESIKPIEEICLFGNITPQEAVGQKQPHEPEREFELEMGM